MECYTPNATEGPGSSVCVTNLAHKCSLECTGAYVLIFLSAIVWGAVTITFMLSRSPWFRRHLPMWLAFWSDAMEQREPVPQQKPIDAQVWPASRGGAATPRPP